MSIIKTLSKIEPYILDIFRILIGYLLLIDGLGMFFEISLLDSTGGLTLSPITVEGIKGLLEIIGGIFLILGLFTRFISLVFAILFCYLYFTETPLDSAVKYLLPTIMNEHLIFLSLFFLYFIFYDHKFSLDTLLFKSFKKN